MSSAGVAPIKAKIATLYDAPFIPGHYFLIVITVAAIAEKSTTEHHGIRS